MFVILIDGADAFAVEPNNVCALESHAGGRDTLVILVNGGTKLIHGLNMTEVMRRFAHAQHDNWLDGEEEKAAAASRAVLQSRKKP